MGDGTKSHEISVRNQNHSKILKQMSLINLSFNETKAKKQTHKKPHLNVYITLLQLIISCLILQYPAEANALSGNSIHRCDLLIG